MEDVIDKPALSVNGFIVFGAMIVLALVIIGAGGENGAVGTAVSYTHLRAHET